MFIMMDKTRYVLISVDPAVVRRLLKVEKSGEARALAISGHSEVMDDTTSEIGTALAPLMETVAAIVRRVIRC